MICSRGFKEYLAKKAPGLGRDSMKKDLGEAADRDGAAPKLLLHRFRPHWLLFCCRKIAPPLWPCWRETTAPCAGSFDLGVDDPAEGLAELDELLLAALPRQVDVQDLGRRLRVAELRLPGRGRHGHAWTDLRSVEGERVSGEQSTTATGARAAGDGRSKRRRDGRKAGRRRGEEVRVWDSVVVECLESVGLLVDGRSGRGPSLSRSLLHKL